MANKRNAAIGVIFVIALFVGAVYFAQYIESNDGVKELIASFGPLGIILVSFVGGLNLVVPVPATAFIPVFVAAGFNISLIIGLIVLGMTVADLLSFYIGTVLKRKADKSNMRVLNFLREHCQNKPKTTQLVVFLYASFIPLPNEVLLLPLGTLGVKLQTLLLAFVLGNVLHVSLLAFGLTSFL